MRLEVERKKLFMFEKTPPAIASLLWAGFDNFPAHIAHRAGRAIALRNEAIQTLFTEKDFTEWTHGVFSNFISNEGHTTQNTKDINDFVRLIDIANATFGVFTCGGKALSFVTLSQLHELAAIEGLTPPFLSQDGGRCVQSSIKKEALEPRLVPPCIGLDESTRKTIEIMIEAADHFWGGVTSSQWASAPNRKGKDKPIIIEWLMRKGLNKTSAMYIDVLIRPDFAKVGGVAKVKGK